MDSEKLIQTLSNQQLAQAPLVGVLSQYLSVQEAVQIIERFQSEDWLPNGQVLWSGIHREMAQEWADRHQLQTLTTAMGPLMDINHPDCLKSRKNNRQWSNYVHGASAIFAWRIAQGEKVTLLSPPPPERFHPSGLSYYQLIEEPIIRGLLSHKAVQQIIITHPMIEESDGFFYELWPNDRSDKWIKEFGSRSYGMKWRQVGHSNDITRLKSLMALPEKHVYSAEQFQQSEKQKVRLFTYFVIYSDSWLMKYSRFALSNLMGFYCYLYPYSFQASYRYSCYLFHCTHFVIIFGMGIMQQRRNQFLKRQRLLQS